MKLHVVLNHVLDAALKVIRQLTLIGTYGHWHMAELARHFFGPARRSCLRHRDTPPVIPASIPGRLTVSSQVRTPVQAGARELDGCHLR